MIRAILTQDSPNGARINVRCYDSEGNQLTNTAGVMVKGVAERTFGWSTNFGGCWRTGNNVDSGSVYVCVDENVKSIHLFVSGGTNATERIYMTGFDVFTKIQQGISTPLISQTTLNAVSDMIPIDTSFPTGTFIKDLTGAVFGWEYKAVGGVNQWVVVPNPVSVVNATKSTKGIVNQSDKVDKPVTTVLDQLSAFTGTTLEDLITYVNSQIVAKFNPTVTVINSIRDSVSNKIDADIASGQQSST